MKKAPKTYTPKQIAAMLGDGPQDAVDLADTVDAFWPTIKAALLAYGASNPHYRVAPREIAVD